MRLVGGGATVVVEEDTLSLDAESVNDAAESVILVPVELLSSIPQKNLMKNWHQSVTNQHM